MTRTGTRNARTTRSGLIGGAVALLTIGGTVSAQAWVDEDEIALPAAIATQMDFREVVHRAKGEVFPALVFLKCIRESHESGERQSQEVSGSGVLISANGELLTNWHVVDRATQVRCLLYDGRAYDAEVVGTDRVVGLAGGVWEWTRSAHEPYPGYTPPAGPVGE